MFSSVNYIRNFVNKETSQQGKSYEAIVLDCTHITSIDFTTVKGFMALIGELQQRGKQIIFYNPNSSVTHTFLGVCSNDIAIAKSLDDLNLYV